MSNEFCEGHRVRHLRDGLVGTVAGIEHRQESAAPVRTYQVQWDNGSFESRIDPSEITLARPCRPGGHLGPQSTIYYRTTSIEQQALINDRP